MNRVGSSSIRRSLLLGLLLFGGCTGVLAGEGGGRRGSFISNGQEDPGHPTVGLLQPTLCTATLVGDRTVLTAAHCIEEAGEYAFTLDGKDYAVESLTPHPDYAGAGQQSGEPETFAHDLAVLRLKDHPGIVPTPLLDRAPKVGDKLVLVGFGATSFETADWGLTKRWASNQIATLAGDYLRYTSAAGVALDAGAGGVGGDPDIEAGESTATVESTPVAAPPAEVVGNVCPGDSGGPSFVLVGGVEAQAGVHSMGDGVDGYDRRVDLHLAWIKAVAGGDIRVYHGGSAAR